MDSYFVSTTVGKRADAKTIYLARRQAVTSYLTMRSFRIEVENGFFNFRARRESVPKGIVISCMLLHSREVLLSKSCKVSGFFARGNFTIGF